MLRIYKPIGISCATMIRQLKELPEYKDQRMAFSGRLDEMAHGIVLILVGDNTKKSPDYDALRKTYRFRFIIGVETDTTSTLGIIQNKNNPSVANIEKIEEYINSCNNKTSIQEYHIFSSFVPKHNKYKMPLFQWALDKKLDELMEIPKKEVTIFDIKMLSQKEITVDNFVRETLSNLNKLNQGEFRKEIIVEQWKNFLKETCNISTMCEIECMATVSSGFYVRQFVKDIGKIFNINVVVTEIERLKI
jgi:tRNA pseudouridine(55) synthase